MQSRSSGACQLERHQHVYDRLFELLDELEIADDSLPAISAALEAKTWHRNTVAQEVFWEIVSNLNPGEFLRSPGFKMIAQGGSLAKREPQLSGTLVKKFVSMTTSSLFEYGNIENEAGGEGDAINIWDRKAQDSFVQFLLKYRSLVEKNLVVPIATIKQTVRDDMGSRLRNDGKREAVGTSTYHRETFNVSLDYDELYRQLSETPARVAPPAGAISLYLPHLANVDLKDIVRLREDEQDAFIRYHRTLSKLFSDSKLAKNEHALLDAMREVDDGIRRTSEAFESVRRSNRYSKIGLAVGITSAALCVVAPEEVAEYLQALVGGATAAAGFKYLSTRQAADDRAKDTDFYFPWRLSKLSV